MARLANLDILVADQHELQADLSVNVECGPPPQPTQYKTAELSPLIATTNTKSVVFDVLLTTGVSAKLDVGIQATLDRVAGLEVYVTSEDIRIGAAAQYDQDGDEVEVVIYVEDKEILHPEFVRDLTATLVYKAEHSIGSVSIINDHGLEDGTIRVYFMHPAHAHDLEIRFQGLIEFIGNVDFKVPVLLPVPEDMPLSENVHDEDMSEIVGRELRADEEYLQEPREEPHASQALSHTLDEAPEEIERLDPAVVLVLLKLNMLSQYEYMEMGNGPLEYTGGGNRLLSSLRNDGTFVYQGKNQLPPNIGGHTHIERNEVQLLPNSNFATPTNAANVVPLGYELEAPTTITVLPEIGQEASGIGLLKVRAIGSGPFTGSKVLTFRALDAVAVTSGPVTWSILARSEWISSQVSVSEMKLVMSFRDGSDVEISNQAATFNPSNIRGDDLVLLNNTVDAVPLGTASVRVSVEIGSIDASDDITFYFMAPMLAANTSATSRIVGDNAPVSRVADMLRVPQRGNIELRRGSITTIFAPSYDGFPAEETCMFDTRDEAGLNGFALFHLTDGRLMFEIGGPVTPKQLETGGVFAFQVGIFEQLTVEWTDELMRIKNATQVVAEDDTSVVLPGQLNEWVYLFRTTDETTRLDGELGSFVIRRDFAP